MTARRELPPRRHAETFEMRHGDQRVSFVVTIGRYSNGDIGEVFVGGAKAGSTLEAVARDGAVLVSLALQHNISLDVIRHALTRNQDGSASSIIGAVVDRMALGR